MHFGWSREASQRWWHLHWNPNEEMKLTVDNMEASSEAPVGEGSCVQEEKVASGPDDSKEVGKTQTMSVLVGHNEGFGYGPEWEGKLEGELFAGEWHAPIYVSKRFLVAVQKMNSYLSCSRCNLKKVWLILWHWQSIGNTGDVISANNEEHFFHAELINTLNKLCLVN